MDETCFLFPSLAVASLYGSLCTAQTGLLSLRLELLPLAAQRTAAEGPARPLCQSLHGGGNVIVFADDMNFRSYWMGTSQIFLNAIFFGGLI